MLNFQKIGLGKKSIIFLHGWQRDLNDFNLLIDELNLNLKKYSLYLIDLPGHGNSIIKNSMNIKQVATQVINLIKKEKIENASFITHSYGTRVVSEILGNNKYKADKLFIINGAGIKKRKNIESLYNNFTYKINKLFIITFFKDEKQKNMLNDLRYAFSSDDYNNANEIMKENLIKAISYDQSKIISQIKVKTFLIWGKNDTSTPLEIGKKFNKLIKNSKLFIIDGDHDIHLNKTNEVAKIIKRNI